MSNYDRAMLLADASEMPMYSEHAAVEVGRAQAYATLALAESMDRMATALEAVFVLLKGAAKQ